MRAVVPTPETQRRIDAGETFIRWLVPRLAGSDDERETALVMISAQIEARYAEGVEDAASLAKTLLAVKPNSRELQVTVNALVELAARHREKPVVSFDKV